jgi:Carbohydrate-binding family 9
MMAQEPKITAHYVAASLNADGFDHPEWKHAPAIQIARKWSGEDAPTSRHAEVRIIWSAVSLQVRFVCRQAEPLIVSKNPQLDQKSIGLWERDVCEIFIAPNPEQPENYFEFEVAPTGEWLDLGIRVTAKGRETDWDYYSGMTAAHRVARDQVMLMMCIPWSAAIPRPNPGDVWRINLFRCVGVGNERYLAWQPTYTPEPYFHLPQCFGQLEFL